MAHEYLWERKFITLVVPYWGGKEEKFQCDRNIADAILLLNKKDTILGIVVKVIHTRELGKPIKRDMIISHILKVDTSPFVALMIRNMFFLN